MKAIDELDVSLDHLRNCIDALERTKNDKLLAYSVVLEKMRDLLIDEYNSWNGNADGE